MQKRVSPDKETTLILKQPLRLSLYGKHGLNFHKEFEGEAIFKTQQTLEHNKQIGP